jgi:hypothetical protein
MKVGNIYINLRTIKKLIVTSEEFNSMQFEACLYERSMASHGFLLQNLVINSLNNQAGEQLKYVFAK